MPGAKMREMGLGRAGGGAADVTLAEAREKAAALFKLVRSGVDPWPNGTQTARQPRRLYRMRQSGG